MDIVRREFLRGGAAVLGLAAERGFAWAESYPVKPVRVIVPFSMGGPPDLMARLIAHRLTEIFKQPFVVENVIGAGGNTGIVAAAKAPADGYTIAVISTAFFANPTLHGCPTTRSGTSPRSVCWRPCRTCSWCIRPYRQKASGS